jgi:CopG family nickel-responsive transcriptional regulator
MTVISVSIPDKLLEKVDRSIKEQGFANRSGMIRQALRAFMVEGGNLRELEGEIASTITIIYKKKAKREQVSDIQHNYGDIISTFLHAHLYRGYCLEVIVVRGKANTVRELVDALRTNEQIAQIKVALFRHAES